jgi:predicted DNA-binding antitoxin AbrB/MazE fold protein
MSQIITVTYDGEVLKPSQKLSLNVGKQYQIELLDDNSNIFSSSENQTNIRSHESFLNGYASEDEGLYDDY